MFQDYLGSGSPNPMNQGTSLWCEICETRGQDHVEDSYILHKYIYTPRSLYCKFWKCFGHYESNFMAYDLMMDQCFDFYRM